MPASDLQSLCELGQHELERMEYLAAEATLVKAEALALAQGDFDTLGRLYMPLQEARRQRRQRCGEGVVCLDLIAPGPLENLCRSDGHVGAAACTVSRRRRSDD